MTKEDPSEALQGPEVQEAGESSPRLGYETYLSSGGHGSTSPTTLDWGQPAGWVCERLSVPQGHPGRRWLLSLQHRRNTGTERCLIEATYHLFSGHQGSEHGLSDPQG